MRGAHSGNLPLFVGPARCYDKELLTCPSEAANNEKSIFACFPGHTGMLEVSHCHEAILKTGQNTFHFNLSTLRGKIVRSYQSDLHTCSTTFLMRAFMASMEVLSCCATSWKYHSTRPPLVMTAKKSNILQEVLWTRCYCCYCVTAVHLGVLAAVWVSS